MSMVDQHHIYMKLLAYVTVLATAAGCGSAVKPGPTSTAADVGIGTDTATNGDTSSGTADAVTGGTVKWRFDTGKLVACVAVASDGSAYFGADDRNCPAPAET